MLNITFRAVGAGTGAGTASRYGSGATKMIRLLVAGTSRSSYKIGTYKNSTYRSLFLQPNIPTKFVPTAHCFYSAIFLQLVIPTK
jgi:hypothetical protein